MTQKELAYKMLRSGRSTKDFLNSRLCAEYRKWISIIRQELKGTGEYVEATLVDTKPRNYFYKIDKLERDDKPRSEGDSAAPSELKAPSNLGGAESETTKTATTCAPLQLTLI